MLALSVSCVSPSSLAAPVLGWDGELSSISRDAIQDTRDAIQDTVIDEWDEDFDGGKVSGEKQASNQSISQSIDRFSVIIGGGSSGGKSGCLATGRLLV